LLADPDHKSALQEWLQSRGLRPAEYHVVRETGPEHQKTFRIGIRADGRALAEADGHSKKVAEQAAAALALSLLRAEGTEGAVPDDAQDTSHG
jgi:ribonuclease-3